MQRQRRRSHPDCRSTVLRIQPYREDTITVPLVSIEDTNVASNVGTQAVVLSGMRWIEARLKALGKSGAAFGRALKIPKERVYEMYRGDRRFKASEIAPAAAFLEMSENELARLVAGYQLSVSPERMALRINDEALPTLVVWKSAVTGRERSGAFLLTNKPDGDVDRPKFLEFSEKAFGCRVLTGDNDPVFRLRDIVLVNPDEPLEEGDDCLFLTSDGSTAEAIIGRLIRIEAGEWIMRQYAAASDRSLDRGEFQHAWRIVGRYYRR